MGRNKDGGEKRACKSRSEHGLKQQSVFHQTWGMCSFKLLFCMCLCNPGGSDDSLLGSDEEEQELWEETQIGKGVKRQPGEQVRESINHIVIFLPLIIFFLIFLTFYFI